MGRSVEPREDSRQAETWDQEAGIWARPAAVAAAAALLALAAYLPVFNNFFIADDFVYLSQIRMALADPAHLLRIPPGVYRLTGHLYFVFCYEVFGLHAAGYYAVSLLLHAACCLLVYELVRRVGGRSDAAAGAVLFFAVYERHHEAVMWISAASELIATMAILACLLLWERFLRPIAEAGGRAPSPLWPGLAMLAFAAGLLSKESAVVAVALLLLLDFVTLRVQPSGSRFRALRWVPYLVMVLISAWYLRLVYAADPLVHAGFYAVGRHSLFVYFRSLNTLALFVAVAAVIFLLARGHAEVLQAASRNSQAVVFFLGWLLITPLPSSFATYIDQLPSRQTYLPSVGTAALVGLLAAELLRQAGRRKTLIMALSILALAGNAAYIWKKDGQFEKRAAPTLLLVQTLGQPPAAAGAGKVYIISASEYQQVITRAAVELCTGRKDADLVFVSPQEAAGLRVGPADFLMQWDERGEELRLLRRPIQRVPG